MKRTYKVSFSSIFANIPAPKPVKVTVDDTGKTSLETEVEAIIKAMEEHNISDDAFRPHATPM